MRTKRETTPGGKHLIMLQLTDGEMEALEELADHEGGTFRDAVLRAIEPVRRYITVPEAADRLSVSKPTIYRLCTIGRLRSKKVGTARRVEAKSLENYLDGKR